jgi:hypothetical protein
VQKVVLTNEEWSHMVSRLNDASRRKQMFLLQAQHKQIKDELEGLTFTPAISGKSREMALNLKSLPDRVSALMRKRRAKLDSIRHEKAQEELKEATFKPRLNKWKPKSAATVGGRQPTPASDGANMTSTGASRSADQRMSHLLQYEMDRRLRQTQRRQLIEEMEDKELTFTPAINSNSVRIVDRMARERRQQAQDGGLPQDAEVSAAASGLLQRTGTPLSPKSSRAATKRALVAAMAATAASSGSGGLSLPRGIGRSYLPGHEEETFHPRINPRSATLHRPGLDDTDVYNRLYAQKTVASAAAGAPTPASGASLKATKAGSTAAGGPLGGSTYGAMDGSLANATLGSVAAPGAANRDASGFPVDEFGEPAPGHPHYFNTIAFEAGGKMDFLLRRLLQGGTPNAATGLPA